ncbi:LOW QUALITY PROTEIN: transcription factor Gibbin [Menidia menidia]
MSGLSDHLHSGQTGAPVGCGEARPEERGCAAGLPGLEAPEFWTRELALHGGFPDPSRDGLASVTPDHAPPTSPSALSNGVHLQGGLGRGARRGELAEARSMQTHMDPDVHAQAFPHMDTFGHMEIGTLPGALDSKLPKADAPEAVPPTSPRPLSLALGNHPALTNQLAAPLPAAQTDTPSTFCPNQNALPAETEKKYALRSSGRPRFPCHLRKSSRLRRGAEDGDKRAEPEDEETLEERIWKVKEEEVAVGDREEHSAVEAVLPTPTGHTDVALAPTAPKPAPKSVPKTGLRLGHKPGPKSRCRPPLKSVHKAAPKSIMKQRQAAQALQHQRAAPAPPLPPALSAPPLAVRDEAVAELGVCLTGSSSRRGRFVGVRRIVVKVARIPVSLSRRQKSYKISNLETVTGTEKSAEGGVEGPEAVREPTALLRMKNNGKSVMVMFPPGELPVILKRRRGRPPKQPPPGGQGDPPNAAAPPGETPKKPRRRRRTKLPLPFPSYVSDTNDVKTEYGDVLSKLAFLNRQPPATGRSSPPRCWTPSDPESFHAPVENPGISALLHRLTGFRRPRGGRGGGLGRGGAAGGGAGGGECRKSSFCDFFESIGKKRKVGPLPEHGLPRKRGKGMGGRGVGRGGGLVGTEPGGEKTVKKRRMRKNGAFKGGGVSVGQDWPNGAGGWAEEGLMLKEKGLGGYQLCGSSRGGFSSCELGRGGAFGGPGGGRGLGEDSQGLFAGYFRSLLDSDDSSDLLDVSSGQPDPRKAAASTPGFEPSSPAHSWSPAFPKWSAKGPGGEGPAQPHCSSARPPFGYESLAQTSPTTPVYPKSTPPSLSHSPSSPHPASYGHFSSGYSCSSPAAPQRASDCSFAYLSGPGGGKPPPAGHMGYSSYQTAKRGFSGLYPGASHSSMMRGDAGGPTSPGGGYMSVAKSSPFSSSPLEGYRQYGSNQWSYRQGYGGWPTENFGSQYHGYGEYGSNESKDILDISNYTPQKAKRQPFPESLSESSSDSSHLGSAATVSCPVSTGAVYRPGEAPPAAGEGAQSSLSSLEKLMMDWHDGASGPSYNWSQNVLFQSAAAAGKPGRGRRKRTDPPPEKEAGSGLHSDSPSSPSPTPAPGPRRGGGGGRGRGSRGGRGGLSPCQRERPSGAKGRGKAGGLLGAGGGPDGLFQEGLDYYSGDSSSLSPLATPTPAPPPSYLQDPCEYPSPYSAHPSTPSSEERYPALYPGESSSSISPSVSSPPYPPKPTPPPPQSYHLAPSRTFSPSCSPSPRLTPHCGTALSPSHRPPPKEPPFSQYDSPSYCGSPYWYGQTSHSGSPSPHSHPGNPHGNPHASPHGNALPGALTSPTPSALAHMAAHDHHGTPPHAGLSTQAAAVLQTSLLSHPISTPHLPGHAHAAPSHAHSASMLYEERSPPAAMTPHKREMAPGTLSTGLRPGPPPPHPASYPKPPLDSSPHQEDYSLPQPSYQSAGHRYAAQAPQGGGGVLCQLLDPTNEDSFSVTSL